MIKKIEIKNFRNIKHLELMFEQLVSILNGANGIGKSNTLNAVHWLLTNTLLTDKWGVGENDLDSIVPKDFKKGEHTEVSIYIDEAMVKFTKLFKTKDKGGHYTEYKINEASYGGVEWQQQLFEKLYFTPKLKCTGDVNELRVMIDPLYSFQKLEAKQLRALLVALGCSVTNEEVFTKYPQFKLLEEEAVKYNDDYTAMRKSLKTQRLEQQKQVEILEGNLMNYADVEEFNPALKEKLEAQRDELVTTIRNLRKGDVNLTNEIDMQIQKLEAEKTLYVQEAKAQYSQNLALLNQKLKTAQDESYKANNELLNKLNEELRIKYQTKGSLETTIKAYNSTRESKRAECVDLKNSIENLTNRISYYNNLIEEETKKQFIGYVTCPDCGKIFAADADALLRFNKQKQDNIARYNQEISNLNIEIKEKEKQFEVAATFGRNAKDEEEKTTSKLHDLLDEINNINTEILSTQAKEVDLTKVNQIKKEIEALNADVNTTKFDVQLDQLRNKRNSIVESSAEANAREIEAKEAELDPIKEAIENEYMKMSKYNSKLEFEEKKAKVTKALNDTEHLLEKVTEFIQKRISLINDKAREITGIDFVMLEENLTNDNVKEVCYATVDGVEFGSVNTSQKIEIGVKFIHRIKEILGANNLPILADRLEGFDDIEKIKNLTTEQMICTVVGNRNQKEIVII